MRQGISRAVFDDLRHASVRTRLGPAHRRRCDCNTPHPR